MKRCAIISGGDFSPLDGIEEYEYIIACDRGLEYARKWGIMPDLIIGDFDSFTDDVTENTEVCRLPVEKDDTDTMSAVRRALSMGAQEINLYCALGGRLDHLLANIQTLGFIVEHGARGKITAGDTQMTAFTSGSIELPKRTGMTLSVFSLTDSCEGVSIKGAKYPLDNVVVTNSFPIGVSNEWQETVRVSVNKGTLLVMTCAVR